MFADISGFTPLAERLALRGPEGAEELSVTLNRSFGRLLAAIAADDGEAITFAGDALLAVWPADGDDLATAVARAAHCGGVVQSPPADAGLRDGDSVSLRIGVGAGRITALRVGGAKNRWYLLICGAALQQATQAQSACGSGDVLFSPQASRCVAASSTTASNRRVRLADVEGQARSAVPRPLGPEQRDAIRAYVPESAWAGLTAGHGEWLAELRPVTPLFVALPDIDPVAPEPLEPVQRAVGVIQPILQSLEATPTQVIVDDKGLSVVAVFGLRPLAHEDDAARAARAALAISDALRQIEQRSAIGCATGRAFCGVVGSDLRREYTVVGDVMNVAARLAEASGDSILCDDRTARAAHAHVGLRPQGSRTLKGKAAPVAVWTPLGATSPSREERPIFGRESERARIIDRLRALKSGISGAVVIEGDAGIGKSRLLSDLLEQARARGMTAVSGGGDAIERTSPYHAWRPIVTQLLDDAPVADGGDQRARWLEHLRDDFELQRLAPLLGDVLPINLPDNDLTRQLSGQLRADGTRQLLLGLLRRAARGTQRGPQPLLVILDDAHWLDSLSWGLARAAVSEVERLLLVIAHRPVIDPVSADWGLLLGEPGVERLRLNRLPRDDALALVCDRLGVSELPERVARVIESRAQGNPFFSEQLARALIDDDLIRITDGACTLAPGVRDLSAVSFPDTAHAVVAGRIDRLSTSHALTLKTASVIGLAFRSRVVRDVHPIEAERRAVTRHLNDLHRHGFTLPAPAQAETTFTFTHAVTQEAAYGLLLESQRRRLHRAVAEWYEGHDADGLAAMAPLLAYHWQRAAEPTKTLPFLEIAGEAALLSGAYEETVGFLTSALPLVRRVDPPPEARRQARWHRELADAYMGLGQLHDSRRHAERAVALAGWPVPATALGRGCDLMSQLLEQTIHRTLAHRRRASGATAAAGALEAARAYERLTILNYFANARTAGVCAALHAVNLAERVEPSPELARGYALMCVAAGVVGVHPLARSYSRWARQIARASTDQPALSRVLMATTLYDISIGGWDAARHALTEGLDLAEHLRDHRSWGEFAFASAVVMYHQGEFARLAGWSARLKAAADQADDAQRMAHALMTDVWICLPQGRLDIAAARLDEVVALLADRHAEADEIHAYGILALVHLRRGDSAAARTAGETAMRLISRSAPTAMYALEGYGCLAETFLTLWAGGDRAAARNAREACRTLRRLARVFPIARPRALLCSGAAADLAGDRRCAAAYRRKSLATAERLAMPYEQARAHRAIGQHLATNDPARDEHLSRARAIFAEIGATDEPTALR